MNKKSDTKITNEDNETELQNDSPIEIKKDHDQKLTVVS